MPEKPQYIPDPIEDLEAGDTSVAVARRTSSRGYMDARELLVQDYWKTHAQYPETWTTHQASRDAQQQFCQSFRENAAKILRRRSPYATDEASGLINKLVYVVISLSKVGIRSRPTEDPAAKTGKCLEAGTCVVVDSVVTREGNRYLKLNDGSGWVFQHKQGLEVMAEMTRTEVGLWWYRVCCQEFVEVRKVPLVSDTARTGWVMCPDQVCVVGVRCLVHGIQFVQLADGRGWVFEKRPPGAPEREFDAPAGPRDGRVLIHCEDVTEASQPENNNAPAKQATLLERGSWLYEALNDPVLILGTDKHGLFLQPGEAVQVDMRVSANGQLSKEVSSKTTTSVLNRIWLRLEDGRGWIPKTDTQSKPLVKFLSMQSQAARSSAWSMPPIEGTQSTRSKRSTDWRVGVV